MINDNSIIAREICEKGFSESCPIIDMHAHMFNFSGGYMIANTPEKMLKFMDRANVKLTLFVGHRSLFEGASGIADDLAVAKKYSERFKCYYPVLSRITDVERDLRSVAENSEYVGFKFLCDYYGVPLSDKRHEPYWQFADEHNMPVLVHTWGGSSFNGIDEAEKILERFPNMSFVAGHSFHTQWDKAVLLAKKYKNLYLEMTAVLSGRNRVERFIDAGLNEQIVFGVDAPWFSYEAYIGALLSAEMNDEDIKNILYRNACKILKKANIQFDIGVL